MAYLLNKPQREIYNREFLYGYIVFLLLIMIITGIGFIRRSSVSLAAVTLILGQITIAHAYLKDLTLDLSLNTTSIGTTYSSSLFRLAFISYLYFEFSLQTGYLYSLTAPTLDRQKRVGKQLSRLSEFRLGITKLESDAEKERSTLQKDEVREEDEEERTSSALAAGSGSTSAKKYSADALLFLLDSAQDSLFAKPGGEQERLTGRLQRYHDGLLQHDPKLDDKLGGSASKAFNPFIVLVTVFTSLIFRLILLVILSWLVLKPEVLLTFISLPETIINSLEITQPEGILIALIPVVFLIIGGSYLVARLQEWIVKAEELIIEEADIGRFLRAGRAITTREEGQKITEELETKDIKDQQTQSPPQRRRRRTRKEN